MEYVLGVDIGSSATKAGVFSIDGHAVAVASRPHATREPLPGYKEQDPECWWESTVECIREVIAAVPPGAMVGIGATGHISSMTFVDAAGKPLRPAIGFQDQRAVCEVEEIHGIFGRPELALHLGIDLPPAATWPLPRLLWFRKHEPRTLERARCVLQAKDFVNLRLTGEFASDRGSNRGIVNLETGRIPAQVFTRLGLPDTLAPRMFEPTDVVGALSGAASRATGLPQGLAVVAGWNDLNASVLGSGMADSGGAFHISGTSEHIGLVTTHQYASPQLICAPYLPGRRLLYGVTSCGGGSLEWYREAFRRDLAGMLDQARRAPAGCEGLTFLPYLQGERAPIWDPFAAGAFVGIGSGHGEGHFVRAILEGVGFSLRQILEIVERQAGGDSAVLTVTGGGARIALWNRIKSDVLERVLVMPEQVHAGVLGAAILAAVGIGRYGSCDAAAHSMVRFREPVRPDPETSAIYQAAYARYCELYPALKRWFAGSPHPEKEIVTTYV